MLNKNSNALYAMNLCARYIHQYRSSLNHLASILQITSNSPRRLSRTFSQMQSVFGTLSARSHQGFNSRLKGVARGLAVVIGLSLSIASIDRSEASIVPLKVLANKQLSDKQYNCHNEIVYRESRWKIDAVNGSHYGYYQIRSKSVQNKPYDYQFYIYWYYVFSRYGYTEYDEPNYCLALKHLKTKGWQ